MRCARPVSWFVDRIPTVGRGGDPGEEWDGSSMFERIVRLLEDMHNEEICHTLSSDDTWIKLDPSDNPNIYPLEVLHTTHRSASLVHHDRR